MPFSAANLENERTRISNLFRNNGYYYYVPGYATYLADTFAVESKSQLRFQLINELPQEVLKKWYIGNIDIQFRKSFREQLTDSLKRRHLTFHYNGKRLPVIPGVILRNLRLRPRQEYSYDNHMESASKINATGVFSSTDFQFTPRPNTDTLDLSINCVFDKPYDFYIEGNAIGRTNGRVGPEAKIGFTKRNLFRGAEKLDLNLHGSYQWQTSADDTGGSYQYGADVSLEFPRIIAPFYNSERIRRNKNGTIRRRRRFYAAPTTLAKISTDIIQRPEYYKMHVVSGEWTYRWQPTETSRHEFSPLTLKYQFKNSTTEKYQEIVDNNMFLERTMQDYFVPKMRYTYTYTSPSSKLNPIRWETTIEESGNFVSLLDMIRGNSFNEKDKKLFKTPYSQFLRFETDFTKTWSLGNQTKLVSHINTGIIWSYGNSDVPPFSEQFYAGGANSIRAFRVRDVGPGRFNYFAESDRQFNYLFRNGEMKLIMNLEYRTPLWGNLHGAVFLDAGNVWDLWGEPQLTDDIISQYPEEVRPYARVLQMWEDQSMFKPSEFFNDIALGTGVGLRYDLGFLVIRLDWGIALHFPYTTYKDDGTQKGGYFNIARFKDAHTLNFAVGYPF
jgi:outer membrane protein assembly factor BamA